MRQWLRGLGVGIGTILALVVGACFDGRWQSEPSTDANHRAVKVVRASSLVVASARFIVVVFDAGRPGRFGLRLESDESLLRARVVLRLADRDGEHGCSFEADCRALYMEDSDITPEVISLRMRGTVTLRRNWRGRVLSAHLRVLPKDEGDSSQRYVGSDGTFLKLDLEPVHFSEDAALASEIVSWREMGAPSELRAWQDEIARAIGQNP